MVAQPPSSAAWSISNKLNLDTINGNKITTGLVWSTRWIRFIVAEDIELNWFSSYSIPSITKTSSSSSFSVALLDFLGLETSTLVTLSKTTGNALIGVNTTLFSAARRDFSCLDNFGGGLIFSQGTGASWKPYPSFLLSRVSLTFTRTSSLFSFQNINRQEKSI